MTEDELTENEFKRILERVPFYITKNEIEIVKEKFWDYGWKYLVEDEQKKRDFDKWRNKRDKNGKTIEEKIFGKEIDNLINCLLFDEGIFIEIKAEEELHEKIADTLEKKLRKKLKIRLPFLIKWLVEIYVDELIKQDKIIIISKNKIKLSSECSKDLKNFLQKEYAKYQKNREKILRRKFISNKLYASFKNHPFFNPSKGFNIIKTDVYLDEFFKEVVSFLKTNSSNTKIRTIKCKMCGNEFFHEILETKLSEILLFTQQLCLLMGSSFSETPNFFFYEQNDLYICPLCGLILLLYPFGLPVDQKEFVNVPSIKALFYLNNLLLKFKKEEIYKTLTPNQRLESLISEAILNYEFLKGAWILQNVELIQIEKGGQPKVYTLPVSRTSAELIIRSDVRRSLANLKGQITIVKKEKNPTRVYAQREGIKRFLTGAEGSLVDLTYFALKNDFMENTNLLEKEKKKVLETTLNLAKLEKIRIDHNKERRFKVRENDLIEIWNIGQELKEVKFDKNLEYELLSASLIEDKKRLLEYLSEIDKRNKPKGILDPLCEFIKSKENLNVREIILAFIAGYKSDKSLPYEDMLENPLKIFWKEGKEIGKKIEDDIESRIKKYVFRTISKIRVGDRNGAIFEILRLYLLSEMPVPTYLSVIFKDFLDTEKFKLYAYSFLSGFIGKDERGAGDLISEMEKIGNILKEESLKEKVRKYGYRLLSFIRAGQRAEFAYEIIKLYAQLGKEIPYKFIEILDPNKPIAEFQSLAYGILSGYLKT